MLIVLWVFAVFGVLLALFVGYRAGRISCADQCMNQGGFTVSGIEYSCIDLYKKDDPSMGLPDVLLPPDNGAFAADTLEKLKFLKPVDRQKLTTTADLTESPVQAKPSLNGRRSPFFAEDKHHDCAQCYRDAKTTPRSMICCTRCGNKRCPKADNHRYACTRSNEPDQTGIFDQAPSQLRINGDYLADSTRPDQDVIHNIYSK